MAKVKSIQELLEMKQGIEQKRDAVHTIHINSLDTDFKFKLATRAAAMQAQQLDRIDIDAMIVYDHVIEPNLADPALQEAYNKGCEPHKIVDKLLDMDEVGMVSLAIIGQNKTDIIKEIKNS